MLPRPLARRVVTAARKFQAWEPWEEFDDEHLFAFELPGEPHPVYASVLGSAGQQLGLSLFLGERALEQFRLLLADPRPPIVTTMLLLSFDPPAGIPAEFLEPVRLAGVSDRVVPLFLATDAGGRSRQVRNRELRLIAQVLEAMLQAEEQDLLRPRPFDPERGGKVLTLTVSGENDKVASITARFVTRPGSDGRTDGLIPVPWPLPELPLADAHWIVGLEPSPVDVAGAAQRPELLFFADAATGRLLDMRAFEPLEPGDLEEAVAVFGDMIREPREGSPFLPRVLTFVHQRLEAAIGPGLAALGVVVHFTNEHPVARGVIDRLRQRMLDADAPPDAPAAAPMHDAWTAHEDRLGMRLHDALHGTDWLSQKALTAFFGDPDTFRQLAKADVRAHDAAYQEWYIVSYRGKPGRRTVAERLLAEALPEPERKLLQARIGARAGLYRVAERKPPVVLLSDTLSDVEVEVHDAALATHVAAGDLLPGRVATADNHRFVIAIGPRLPATLGDAAMQHLQTLFGPFTSSDLQQRPQMLAALWRWLHGRRDAPAVRMTNTDGDPLRLWTATFEVADWPTVLAVLRARDDVGEQDDHHWAWLRGSRDERSTVLGELERVADQLLLQVNSDQRLATGRRWLEALPGVRFVGSREQPLDQDQPPGGMRRNRARDVEVDPEERAQLQQHIDAETMKWLDTVVPALGNRTPREAVRTKEGKEQVLRLIRSWPDPGGIQGLRVPRQRMRRELGLDEGSTAAEP